jgi:cysteinyl-tRNA synthetase
MTLKLYNTLTRKKDPFTPLDPKNVRMYVCGPTVYDYAHIGNARPVIVFDVLFRLLRHLYGAEHVTYVRNVTDVDDKINARARDEGVPIRTLTDRTLEQFHADIAALGVLPPTHEPRATETIPEMIAIVERLIARGHAYVAQGHVLFDVTSMHPYGQLSRRTLDDMIAGARVDVAPYKKGEMDFVLWKPSDAETPGWDSHWGRGRPGWHIECSAMSWKFLGEVFDIHGGGIDLVFPHHENELAQTCSAFGIPKMANVWMHNGFLQVEGQKMSKSLGNFVTINELVASDHFGGRNWNGMVLRLAMLKSHYRKPIDWTVDALLESERTLQKWSRTLERSEAQDSKIPRDFLSALQNDLDTSGAISLLHNYGSTANGAFFGTGEPRPPTDAEMLEAAMSLRGCLNLLGMNTKLPTQIDELASQLIGDRLEARKLKNWAESGRIRDELAAMGVVLKDNKDGTTTWEVKR